ncbi:hypothetical protein [Deinococcus kurensis]|uniref:hypothetical protein n=1 Tax=Deinococcus kurensis TaxID=2662757 RepID=UPI0012D2B72C|nr:hypothetical protein [Deinococcus kurensis]
MEDNLIYIVEQIIKFSQDGKFTNPSSDEWLRLHALFYIALEKADDIQISTAITLDHNLELPFYMACDLYQKRLYLKSDNRQYMTEFARFLRLNSNSWNYLADYFDKVAHQLTASSNT